MNNITDTYIRDCFQQLARELNKRQQNYKFTSPYYGNSELGLSIVLTHVDDNTYTILEACIMALGHHPIRECGVVRSIEFTTSEERDKFKDTFNWYYQQQV